MGTSSSKEQVPQQETLRSVFLVKWNRTTQIPISFHQTILVADRSKSGNLDEVSLSTTGWYFHWGSSLGGARSVKNGENPEKKEFKAALEVGKFRNTFVYQGTTSWTNSGILNMMEEYCKRQPYHLLNNNCRRAVDVTMGGILKYTDDNDIKDIVGTIVDGRPGENQEECLRAAELRMKYDLSEEGDDIRSRMGDVRRPNWQDIPDVYLSKQRAMPYTCRVHPSSQLEGGCECHKHHDDHLTKERIGGAKHNTRRIYY